MRSISNLKYTNYFSNYKLVINLGATKQLGILILPTIIKGYGLRYFYFKITQSKNVLFLNPFSFLRNRCNIANMKGQIKSRNQFGGSKNAVFSFSLEYIFFRLASFRSFIINVQSSGKWINLVNFLREQGKIKKSLP